MILEILAAAFVTAAALFLIFGNGLANDYPEGETMQDRLNLPDIVERLREVDRDLGDWLQLARRQAEVLPDAATRASRVGLTPTDEAIAKTLRQRRRLYVAIRELARLAGERPHDDK